MFEKDYQVVDVDYILNRYSNKIGRVYVILRGSHWPF